MLNELQAIKQKNTSAGTPSGSSMRSEVDGKFAAKFSISDRTPEVALFSESKLFKSSSCLTTLGGNSLEFNSLSECHPVAFSLESISLSEKLWADSEVACPVNELLSSSAFHVKLLLVDEPEGSYVKVGPTTFFIKPSETPLN